MPLFSEHIKEITDDIMGTGAVESEAYDHIYNAIAQHFDSMAVILWMKEDVLGRFEALDYKDEDDFIPVLDLGAVFEKIENFDASLGVNWDMIDHYISESVDWIDPNIHTPDEYE